MPDDVLVCRARRGCLSAYAQLNDRHSPLAYRVALRLLGDSQDAENLTREALVAAWQNLSAFRRGSSYAAWLLQILIQRALSRTSLTRVTESSSQPGNVVSGSPPPAQEADAAAAVVAALPPPQRAVIVLHHFEGMPYDQVALITSSTVPAVRRHLLQARRAVVRAMHHRTSHGTVSSADGA
jgi:RNA polymerase sigma-70 factor, ECF subfamily